MLAVTDSAENSNSRSEPACHSSYARVLISVGDGTQPKPDFISCRMLGSREMRNE